MRGANPIPELELLNRYILQRTLIEAIKGVSSFPFFPSVSLALQRDQSSRKKNPSPHGTWQT